jgi:hypothetical protein
MSNHSGAIEQRLGRPDFRLPDGRRRLDVDDHRMLEIDAIIVGIGINGGGVGFSHVAGRRIEVLDLADATPSMRFSHDHAAVDCEGLAADDPFFHPARHHGLEEFPKKIALPETAVTVPGKRRMIGNIAIEPQPTKPAIGEIAVDLVAKATLRANAEAVTHDQHPHHQLRIDRGPSDVTVVEAEMRPQLAQIHEATDLAKQVIGGGCSRLKL